MLLDFLLYTFFRLTLMQITKHTRNWNLKDKIRSDDSGFTKN